MRGKTEPQTRVDRAGIPRYVAASTGPGAAAGDGGRTDRTQLREIPATPPPAEAERRHPTEHGVARTPQDPPAGSAGRAAPPVRHGRPNEALPRPGRPVQAERQDPDDVLGGWGGAGIRRGPAGSGPVDGAPGTDR